MVALKTERQVFLWHIAPRAIPSDGPPDVKLSDIFTILDAAIANNTAFAYLRPDGGIAGDSDPKDSKNCIFIAQMTTTPDGYARTLLLNRGDPDAANPSFLNPVKNTVQHVPPGKDQVQGWSAHMTIAIKPGTDGRHRACFERMTNVSATLAQRYIEALIDQATEGDPKYTYKKTVKKGKKFVEEVRAYKLRLGVNKVPSEKILDDIKNSELSGIKLIRKNAIYDGVASPSIVKDITETLKISMNDVDKNTLQNYIKNVQIWGKNKGYDEIQFEVTNLPGGGSASPRFSLEIADAMDTLYSRSQRITGFGKFLETCYADIDPEISSKMLGLMKDEAHW
jgi:hypothetical protein